MITKIQAYKSSDGTAHSSLEEAQKAEMLQFFKQADGAVEIDSDSLRTLGYAIDLMVSNRDKIIDILTTKSNSLPKARKINGGTKRRTPKPEASLIPMEQSTPPAA